MHHGAFALLANRHAGDPALVAKYFLDLSVADIPHAARFEIPAPRIDPDEVGRAIENTIGRSLDRIQDREHQLHEYVADRARAGLARLGGHQRSRYPVGEELLVGLGALLGADELPPARPLVLCKPALLARGEYL